MAQVTEEKKNPSDETKEEPFNESEYVPANNFVSALLTDLYQITMTYAYWSNKHCEQIAVFDLFFRKCPFKGEYCVFGGLDDVLRFLNTFKYTANDIQLLEARFPTWNKQFWKYLASIDASELSVYAQKEGSVCFPRIPLLRIEGPVAVCQLIETTLLNLVNYASLVTTNASRIRRAVGPHKTLLEFGLRRAQGPDGAMSASKYAYIGGFNGTSNVLAGLTNNIPIKGTHAHSFVSSFTGLKMLNQQCLDSVKPKTKDIKADLSFMELVTKYRGELDKGNSTNDGELAAFIAYAIAYPDGFLALVDTYDTLNSGIVNMICVSLALHSYGYKPIGIRLDSGDLAYLSKESRKYFVSIADKYKIEAFKKLIIVASNDINESVLHALNEQGHEIDSFGIGTHLVTCKRQPALGCVYKLVAINEEPRIKVSQSHSKMTIPGKKMAYRLWTKGRGSEPILDILVIDPSETMNGNGYCKVNKQLFCEHAFDITKRCRVIPNKVEPILINVFEKGKVVYKPPNLNQRRQYCQDQINTFRSDYLRYTNPTPYKVSVSSELRELTQKLWRQEVPVVDYQ